MRGHMQYLMRQRRCISFVHAVLRESRSNNNALRWWLLLHCPYRPSSKNPTRQISAEIEQKGSG